MDKIDEIEKVRQEFLECSSNIATSNDLEELRNTFLGRKGRLKKLKEGVDLSRLKQEERKVWGESFNRLKSMIERKIFEQNSELERREGLRKKKTGMIDITLPGEDLTPGSLHPVTLIQFELEDIFRAMGFMVLDGYEIETDYYNFEALNFPKDHPARDMQDTYFLENGMVLRTHTSACQVRTMEKFKPPFRAIFPGRCFRYEAVDSSHENTFYQLEGLMIDRDIAVTHLIGVMKLLLEEIFKREVDIRLRPGYFPFVEPGFELDMRCLICLGKGCPTCKKSGWIEILPCGMVHPNVLKFGGIDPSEWSGFAFGLGLTRLAMMRYGISDIRVMNSGDIRVMRQFPSNV